MKIYGVSKNEMKINLIMDYYPLTLKEILLE